MNQKTLSKALAEYQNLVIRIIMTFEPTIKWFVDLIYAEEMVE